MIDYHRKKERKEEKKQKSTIKPSILLIDILVKRFKPPGSSVKYAYLKSR